MEVEGAHCGFLVKKRIYAAVLREIRSAEAETRVAAPAAPDRTAA